MRVPRYLTAPDGARLTVRRAWPHDDGRLTFEAVEDGTGRLRAGRIDSTGDVHLAGFGEDPALEGLADAARPASGTLLVHRFRKRAVVRADGAYLKLLPGAKIEVVAAAHATAAGFAVAGGITVPDVVAREGSMLTLSVVPGRSLHELGRVASEPGHGTSALEAAWSAWAEAWPRFALQHPSRGDGSATGSADAAGRLPVFDAEAEARTTAVWVDRCLAFDALPVPAEDLSAVAGTVRARLLTGTPDRLLLAHRDLHDKQLLVDGSGGVGMIDCDTLAVAEAALDLANLQVHLEFREAQGLLSPAGRRIGVDAVRCVAEDLGVGEARMAAYAASTRLRLACVYAFRPQWRSLAARWFAEPARP